MGIVANLLLLGLISHVRGQETTDGECEATCEIEAYSASPTVHGWMTSPGYSDIGYLTSTKTLTKTIITIVNSDLDLTSTTTQLPSDAILPTDENGAPIQSVTYTRDGTILSTTFTYPDMFIEWPASYAWSGQLYTTSRGSSIGECITLGEEDISRVYLTSTPQPSATSQLESIYELYWRSYNATNMTNPRGLSLSPMALKEETGNHWFMIALGALFPDQAAPNSCTVLSAGPHLAGFTETFWKSESKTSFVNATSTGTVTEPEVVIPTGVTSSSKTSSESTGQRTVTVVTESHIVITTLSFAPVPDNESSSTAVISTTVIQSETTVTVDQGSEGPVETTSKKGDDDSLALKIVPGLAAGQGVVVALLARAVFG